MNPPPVSADNPFMTLVASQSSTPRAGHSVSLPLNGDRKLSPAETARYIRENAERNTRNQAASTSIATLPPLATHLSPIVPANSPSRHDVETFFRSAAHRLAAHLARREHKRPPIIIDLGCGAGLLSRFLADASIEGHYIGIDIARHRAWSDGHLETPAGRALTRSLIVGDIAKLDLTRLPPVDAILSSTSLEHIEDDLGAVRKLQSLCTPNHFEAHLVPAEEALALYGPHGWRQYSPLCLRRLFPSGNIHRYGGPAGNRLHRAVITDRLAAGKKDARLVHPHLYARAVECARTLDLHAGNPSPSMYGVIIDP
jgi:SAM-dependent methyltransferase